MKDTKPASPSLIGELFGMFATVIGEIWKVLWPMFKTIVSFTLWVLAAVIIMPCIFVAGTIYPMWEKWGENF